MSAATLPDACRARAERLRLATRRAGITGQMPYPDGYTAAQAANAVAGRIVWDAHAAAEYPRPLLADAVDAEHLRPDLAVEVWHHAAGAAILYTVCCASPAAHRDALTALAAQVAQVAEPVPA